MRNGNDHIQPSKSIRIVQIVLGAIAVVLSLVIIINPGIGIVTLILLLSITLLIVGFERIAAGIFADLKRSSRAGNIVLGALTIVLGFAVIAFPALATIFLVTLLSVGLFFLGIARIIHGAINNNISKWSRALLIGVGILSIAVSFVVLAFPLLGVFLLTLVIAINLLIIGIESIAYGASGKRSIPSSTSYDVYG
jgi:uncharacterized membrane protein HdeD (DUF308 family)